MTTDSAVEITTFSKLKYGEIFIGTKPNGSSFLGMKVGNKQTTGDEQNDDVLVFSDEQPPALHNAGWLDDRPRKRFSKCSMAVADPGF